jgi:hypothetical protein
MQWGIYIVDSDITLLPCPRSRTHVSHHNCCYQGENDCMALSRHLRKTGIRPTAAFITLGRSDNLADKFNYDSIADLIPFCNPISFKIVIDIPVNHKASVMRFLVPSPISECAGQVTSLSLSPVEDTFHLLELLPRLQSLTSLCILWAPSVVRDWSGSLMTLACRLPSLRKFQVAMGAEDQHLMQTLRLPNLDRMSVQFFLSPWCSSSAASLFISSLIHSGRISATQVHVTLLPWISQYEYEHRCTPPSSKFSIYSERVHSYTILVEDSTNTTKVADA